MRRRIAFLLCALMLLCAGCAGEQPMPEETAPPETAAVESPPVPLTRKTPQLIGYIVEDDGSMAACMAMQGFLHMAENLGYPAKLYRAAPAQAAAMVETAVGEGCKGLLIQDVGGAGDAAVRAAIAAGVKTVVPFDRCDIEGLHANVIVDESEYEEEIIRALAARMGERSLKSGRILLYGAAAEQAFPVFSQTVQACCPQYGAVYFQKSAATQDEAVEELAAFLLYNRDIKGMYVMDTDLAVTAAKGRDRASSRFRTEGTPSPSPTIEPTLSPGQTPAPTVAPGLLTEIRITVYARGLSDENLALLQSEDIYGLCIEPYYEASAQAAMTLDQLLSGDLVARVSRVNRPIANAATIDKYLAIYTQTREMFGL